MEFRDLKKQYLFNKESIDKAIQSAVESSHYIMGSQVKELEQVLSEYVGVKHCISCANGTDALQLALMTWEIGRGDAVFVPDFTFFASGEAVSAVGAAPVFVDVDLETWNISISHLEEMIERTLKEGKYRPKAIVAVDIFGQPAEYEAIRQIADKYNLYLLEDAAQSFGANINGKMTCSFGDISATSFFPAKPLGCYGDGGAIFTDNDEWAEVLRSLRIHGKGQYKYDNVRIGMNSRLDTIQAAVLLAKFPIFKNEELESINKVADNYTSLLKEHVLIPSIKPGYYSSWAQYTIRLKSREERNNLQQFLSEREIPTAIYYPKAMHQQAAFAEHIYADEDYRNTVTLCDTVIALPLHPYMEEKDVQIVANSIIEFIRG